MLQCQDQRNEAIVCRRAQTATIREDMFVFLVGYVVVDVVARIKVDNPFSNLHARVYKVLELLGLCPEDEVALSPSLEVAALASTDGRGFHKVAFQQHVHRRLGCAGVHNCNRLLATQAATTLNNNEITVELSSGLVMMAHFRLP